MTPDDIKAAKQDWRRSVWTIATTVHPIQVVDAGLSETEHDFRVDLVVTPDEVIRCARARRPPGILWDQLDGDQIDAVAALAERQRRRRGRA